MDKIILGKCKLRSLWILHSYSSFAHFIEPEHHRHIGYVVEYNIWSKVDRDVKNIILRNLKAPLWI